MNDDRPSSVEVRIVIGLASLASLGTTLMGWVVSGSSVRNSYETFRAAQRIGLDGLTPYRVVWFLVPVLVLGVLLATTTGHSRIGAVLLAIQCLVVGAGALWIRGHWIAVGWGPMAALICSGLGLAIAAGVARIAVQSSVQRRPRD